MQSTEHGIQQNHNMTNIMAVTDFYPKHQWTKITNKKTEKNVVLGN